MSRTDSAWSETADAKLTRQHRRRGQGPPNGWSRASRETMHRSDRLRFLSRSSSHSHNDDDASTPRFSRTSRTRQAHQVADPSICPRVLRRVFWPAVRYTDERKRRTDLAVENWCNLCSAVGLFPLSRPHPPPFPFCEPLFPSFPNPK